MAYTTINKSTAHFETKLWTGTGSAQSITNMDFQPDFIWWKERSSTSNHNITDAVRGVSKQIYPNENNSETSYVGSEISAFNSDGFSIGTSSDTNQNGETYVSWNFKANGAGSANTDGSINTTATSVNTTSGFSISKYTGTGSAGATVGHGLGVAPKMIIVKGLTYADVWIVGGDSLGGWNKEMYLNGTSAVATNNNAFNGVAPTSSVFTLGSGNGTNKSGDTYIAYCFAEKTGYSKFGSYTGNGNADGTFVYTGFKPAFVLQKRSSSTESWQITDSVRDKDVSPNFARLMPNSTSAESTNTTWAKIEKFSNGFKLGGTDTVSNGSGSTYIYMAFAEAPLVGSNNVPCTAR